ncbi:MAG: hypothetical protein H6746_09880 [Deltaproteobacteria bacterium]|nr:hypothetical protein [Deltaproteobacteria bacterium]
MPAELRGANGMRKLNWLLDLADPKAMVRSLSTGELYFLTKDIGHNDAGALLELASNEQLRGILDLDVWSGHEVRFERWLGWLDLARDASLETAQRLVRQTEDELLLLLFTKRVQVHASDLETDTVPDELQLLQTPDFAYWVTIPHEDEDLCDRLRDLMSLLWSSDPERMRELLLAARFELPSAVEESLIFFRQGRLEEMGFVGPEEALRAYAWLDPGRARQRVREHLQRVRPAMPLAPLGDVAQDLVLRDVEPPALLAEALSLLDDDARARVAEAFAYLVHKVFMAWTGDLSHTDELPAVGRHVAALTNLGLAHLADESATTGAQVLERLWAEPIFRVGHSLTVQLARRARKIEARSGARLGLHLLGEPTHSAIASASQARPRYYEGVEGGAAMGYRDFTTIADLVRVETLIDDADRVLAFFEQHLGFSPETLLTAELGGLDDDTRRQVRLETLFRTAMARLLLDEELGFAPLTKAELARAFELLFERDAEAPTLGLPVRRAMDALAPHVDEAVRRWMERAMDELVLALGRVRAHDLDPRYVAELLLAVPDET